MKKIFLLGFLCFASPLFCAEVDPTPAAVKTTSQRTFVLPVNWAETPKLGMVVTIPQAFRPLASQNAADSASALTEYIPDSENETNWTQRITVSKYIGKSVSAQTVSNQLKTLLLEKVTNAKVWVETNSTKPNYQQSMIGLKYDFQNRRELIGAQYNSGPYDCVGVQYSIRPMLPMPDEDVIKIIEDFFKTNIQVVSFTPV